MLADNNRVVKLVNGGEMAEVSTMVVWCRVCGALMGVREPYTNWTVDRNALCAICATREKIIPADANYAYSESDEDTTVVVAQSN